MVRGHSLHRALIAGALLVLFVPPVSAQGDPADVASRLKSLEAQRVTWRAARKATADGKALEAAALYAEMLDAKHPVSPPGTRGDPKVALRGLNRDALRAFITRSGKESKAAAKRAVGEACPTCTGRGVLVCGSCKGRGFREVASGSRVVRRACEPYETCGNCNRSGRSPGTAEAGADLEKLAKIIDRLHDRKKDPVAGLRNLFRQIKKLDSGGLRAPFGAGARLARVLPGRAPYDPSSFDQATRTEFKTAWERVTDMARRDFLRATALDALAFARSVRFLEPQGSLPRGSKLREKAEGVPPRWLSSNPAKLAGRVVRVDVEMGSPSAEALAGDLPFVGVIPVRGVDPDLVRVFAYTKKDRARLEAAGRSGLIPWARKLLASLPRKSPLEADMGEGSQLSLYGRVLARQDQVPPFAFEVWAIETE